MAVKKVNKKKTHRGSLFVHAVDCFTSFIYSLFLRGRLGTMLSSERTLCRESYIGQAVASQMQKSDNRLLGRAEVLVEKNSFVRIVVSLRGILASLKLNVYGMFVMFFGISSVVSYYIKKLISQEGNVKESALITAIILIICSIPFLFSSQPAAQAIFKSKTLSRVVLDFLDIPEEKMRTRKSYGGTEYILFAAIGGLLLGLATYFFHPLYVPAVFAVAIMLFLVFANPETGVIFTLASTPFLQYFDMAEQVLLIMISVTAASYVCKAVQKRRIVALPPEIAMVLLLCGFIFASGIFSAGGVKTFLDSISTVIIILGGFFLTYNLVCSEKGLRTCTKTLVVSFLAISLFGIWDAFYNGISDRIMDSMYGNLASLSGGNVIYIADSGVVYGMFAIFVFPLIFAYAAKRKTVLGTVGMIILSIVALISAWMNSHYEIIVAMVIECCMFWLLYSHKSLTVCIFAAVPLSIVAILYPYAVQYLRWPDISSIIVEYMPAGVSDSSIHIQTVESVIRMLLDGNLSGIGAGQHVFEVVYSQYSTAASADATNPTSMWLQVICWSGIFGFVSFVVFVVLLVKRSLGYFINPYNRTMKGETLALFCGVMTALLFGFVYSIWSDTRMLYLFWVCAGLLMAHIRVGKEQEEKRIAEQSQQSEVADTEIVFYK